MENSSVSFIDLLKSRTPVSLVLGVLGVLYYVFAIVMLLMICGVIRLVPGIEGNPHALIFFSTSSFALTVVFCAYHLGTTNIRRKRKEDKIADAAKRA